MKCFDIVIVGAGPAGSSAAITAAREGVSVLLFEEHPEVGIPLQCAEGLSRSTIRKYLEIKPEWTSVNLSGSIIRGPDRDQFKIEYPNVGWVLNRKVFDLELAQLAQKSGAVLMTNTKVVGVEESCVIVRHNGELKKFKFKFLIGADGIASNVGRWLGIDTRLKISEIEVCAQYLLENIKIEPNYTYLIFDQDIAPGGYAWIFPKSDSTANVGLGLSPLKTKKRAKELLDGWVKREFPEARIKEVVFGGVPAKVLKRFSGKNFFLVGDSARFTDPLSGAGIANGIKSGVIAGRNAVLRIKGKKDYFEKEIEEEILKEIKFHKKVREAYLRLKGDDYIKIFKLGKKFFSNQVITDINTRKLVKDIILSLPHLIPIGLKLFL